MTVSDHSGRDEGPSFEPLPAALDGAGHSVMSSERILAHAKEVVASAEAQAEAARARATELNRRADAITDNRIATVDDSADNTDGAQVIPRDEATPQREKWPRATRLRLPRPTRPERKTIVLGVGALIICGALAASGCVLNYHRSAAKERQRAGEFTAAAEQNAVTLMAIDANKARDDVQRIIDISTGNLKAGMLLNGEEIVKSVEQTKVSTKVAVEHVAVESMTMDSAVILIAARADGTGPSSKPQSRQWRIVMTLQREGGQVKISDIEVVP